jgi:hypothetical protein
MDRFLWGENSGSSTIFSNAECKTQQHYFIGLTPLQRAKATDPKSGTSTPWKLFGGFFHSMGKVIHSVENFFHGVEVPDFPSLPLLPHKAAGGVGQDWN